MPDQPDIENCIGQRRIAEKPALGHDLDQVNTLETSPTLSRLQTVASKLQVEQQGIERVLENARTDNSYWNIGSMWLAANLVVPSFAIGVLGQPVFDIGFIDGALVIVFFNLLGVMTVCLFSTLGPAFGLRQMVLSRFWFGWWGVKLRWSAANIIVGAQLLQAVNPDLPGWGGILIIAFCTLCIVFFGYKVVHAYEYWSWIPTGIVFLVVLGVFAHTGDFANIPMGVGKAEIGKVLSYGSTVFGFGTGYTSLAADYTVYQPRSRSQKRVFFVTFVGIFPTLLFTELLGAAIATAMSVNGGDNSYQEGYNQAGIGGLLGSVLFPHVGVFGKFCLVILALSIVANNCPNIYSVGLTLMVLGRWTRRVPRFVWTVIGSAVYVAIAIPGYSIFEAVLENFMHFIGYWLAVYEGVALTEHIVFRRGVKGYDIDAWDDKDRLPPGIAAVLAFGCGIAGMVLGMSQTWWVGPIAKHTNGGDLGFEMGFLFAAVSYLVMRTFEKRHFGR